MPYLVQQQNQTEILNIFARANRNILNMDQSLVNGIIWSGFRYGWCQTNSVKNEEWGVQREGGRGSGACVHAWTRNKEGEMAGGGGIVGG
jgi:hypothetical protein